MSAEVPTSSLPSMERILGDIVADEAIAAFDQGENAFTLADSAGPTNQGADALDVDHAAVFLCGGGEVKLQGDGGSIDEFHGDHVGAKHRGFELSGDVEQRGGSRGVSRDDHAGKIPFEEMSQFFSYHQARSDYEDN